MSIFKTSNYKDIAHLFKKNSQYIDIKFQVTKVKFYSPHEFKLSIRWYKADAVFRLKLTQLHALVELTVIYSNGRLTRCRRSVNKQIRQTMHMS